MRRPSDRPCYPLRETSQRTLPADYGGPVFVSDIDKTYLATRFSSMKGLARIPLEFAVDKRAISGMAEVLRGIRRGPGPGFASTPLYFVSSSPPQLREVIARKMLLDGVQPDGFTFKDWGRTLRELRPGRLKDHVGFKVAALLTARRGRPLATEHLLGDDVERDAESYGLYAAVLDGRLSPEGLARGLEAHGVRAADRECIGRLVAELPGRLGRVGQIFIVMARGEDPGPIEAKGPRVRAVRDALQLALALFERDLVDRECVLSAAAGLRDEAGQSEVELRRRIDEARARGLVGEAALARIQLDLRARSGLRSPC